MTPKEFISAKLKGIIEQLGWETELGRCRAGTLARELRADLDGFLTPIQDPTKTGTNDPLPPIHPTQSSGIDIEETLKLRARLVKASDDLDCGRVGEALSPYKAALADWENSRSVG